MAENSQEQPLVTVLMPVYNAQEFVGGATQSILDQTYRNFEFLIINDGSTDESEKVILGFKDDRIKYVKNEQNLKLIATLNKGLSLAKGEFIARMDADDIAKPTRLAEQVEFMSKNPNVGVCGTWYEAFGSKNSTVRYPIDHDAIRYMMLYQCPFCHPTVMLRTSVVREHAIEFDADFPHAEDYELWGRLAELCELANLPSVLLQYRLHESNISKLENSTQVRNSNRIKSKLFQQFGIEMSDADHASFERMNHLVRTLSMNELERMAEILERMVQGNRSTRVFDQTWLETELKRRWFETCSNHAYVGFPVWKLYWKHPSIAGSWLNLADTLKLFIKILIKKK